MLCQREQCLEREKQKQVIALGELGWTLRGSKRKPGFAGDRRRIAASRRWSTPNRAPGSASTVKTGQRGDIDAGPRLTQNRPTKPG